MRLQLLLLCIALVCAACGDNRGNGGIQLGDGRVEFDTAAAAKRKAERTIASAIAEEIGVTWRVGTAIAEEPAWDEADERWHWGQATVAVTIAGSGPVPIDEAEIRSAVGSYLAQHQRPGAPAPTITLHIESQSAATPVASATAPADGWRYTLRAGDTLALVSSAYYGSAEHWRRILDANPGLRPEALAPGTVIVIPPAPTAP